MPSLRRLRPLSLVLLSAGALTLPSTALADPGDADPSYGTNGRTVTTFEGGSASAADVLFLGDKTLVVGSVGSGIGLARYTSDGDPDTSFSEDGRAEVPFPAGSPSVTAATRWETGNGNRIAVGASVFSGESVVGVLNEDGTPDTAFGDDGFVYTAFPGYDNVDLTALTVQTLAGGEKKLLAAGNYYREATDTQPEEYGVAMTRYEADGTLDADFGTDGTVLATPAQGDRLDVRDVDVLSDGDIVVAGAVTNGGVTRLYLARHTAASGYLARDTGFGTDGVVKTDLGGRSARASALLVDPGDKLTVAGSFTPAEPADAQPQMLVARFGAAGAVDTTFGPGDTGRTTFSFGGGFAFADELIRDEAGRLLAAGQHVVPGLSISLALARLLDGGDQAGEPDQGFASGGALTTSFGAEAEGDPAGIGVQPSGRIVVGGTEFEEREGVFSGAFVVAGYLGGTTEVIEPPRVQITSPVDGQYFNKTLAPSFSGILSDRPNTDDEQEVTVKLYTVENGTAALSETLEATVTPASDGQASPTWAVEPTSELADGTYEIQASQDNASAGTGTSERVRFKVDTVAPAPTITEPADLADVGGDDPTFRGTRGVQSEDEEHSEDVPEVFITICRQDASQCVTQPTAGDGDRWSAQPLDERADGTYTVEVRQRDEAGNEATSGQRTFRLDRTAPALAVDPLPGDGLTSDPSPLITGTRGVQAADASHSADARDVTVKVRRRGGTEVLDTLMDTADEGAEWAVQPTDPLAEGAYDLEVTQADAAGNVSTRNAVLLVDRTAPALSLDGPPADGLVNSRTPALTGRRGVLTRTDDHGADLAKVTVLIYRDGDLVQELGDEETGETFAVTPQPLDDGEYTWEAQQVDAAGNTANTAQRKLRIDTRPPVPVIESPADRSQVPGGNVVVSGRASPNDPREIVVTGHAGVGGTRTARGTVGDDGRWSVTIRLGSEAGTGLIAVEDYTVWATQRDAAGNEGRSPSIFVTVGASVLERPQPTPQQQLDNAKQELEKLRRELEALKKELEELKQRILAIQKSLPKSTPASKLEKGLPVQTTGAPGQRVATTILGNLSSNGKLDLGTTAPVKNGALDLGALRIAAKDGALVNAVGGSIIGTAAGNLISDNGLGLLSDNGLGRRAATAVAAAKKKKKPKTIVVAVGGWTFTNAGKATYRVKLTRAGRKALASRKVRKKGSKKLRKPITLTLASASGRTDGKTPVAITARKIKLR